MFPCKRSALNPSFESYPVLASCKNTHIGALLKVQEQHYNVLGASCLKSNRSKMGSRAKPEHINKSVTGRIFTLSKTQFHISNCLSNLIVFVRYRFHSHYANLNVYCLRSKNSKAEGFSAKSQRLRPPEWRLRQ